MSKTNSTVLPTETAEGVLRAFGLHLTGSIRIWQAGKRKTVFLAESNRGPIAVTRSVPDTTARFALQVQEYVFSRANLAPKVFRTRKKDLLYPFQGAQYTVCRWVSGRHLDLRQGGTPALSRLMTAMAELHAATRRCYNIPIEDNVVRRADQWLSIYHKTIAQMRETLHRPWPNHIKPLVFHWGRPLIAIAESLQQFLASNETFYRRLAQRALNERHIVHGDTTHKNLVVSPWRNTWIDFEKSGFDLQVRDLSSRLERMAHGYWSGWQWPAVEQALEVYNQVLPLCPGERWLLWIDVAFPYRFARLLQKRRVENVTQERLNRIGAISMSIAAEILPLISSRKLSLS